MTAKIKLVLVLIKKRIRLLISSASIGELLPKVRNG